MDSACQDRIAQAFKSDKALQQRALQLSSHSPEIRQFITDVSQYILQHAPGSANGSQTEQGNSKKRKLDGDASDSGSKLVSPGEMGSNFVLQDASFSMPQRKKMNLSLREDWLYTKHANNEKAEAFPLKKYAYALRLPVPEKTQKQYNFCLIPYYGEGIGRKNPQADATADAILWTVNAGQQLSVTKSGDWKEKLESAGDRVVEEAIDLAFASAGVKLVEPDKEEFASAVPEAHRKGETAYHVKAFRGSKDGYLFFLSNGIFFGFKKPLLFFPLDYIQSISYTSVLQRTFNLVIGVSLSSDHPEASEEDSSTEEFEFSMVDQADFAGIDTYIKRHELSDASMASNRRAKKLNINKPKRGANDETANGEEGGAAEESELAKAQQQLDEQEDDEEDEEEEDYDPGSEGESEGEGSSADEEDEEMQDGDGEAPDIVNEELGSEAEDVEISEEEAPEEEEEEEEPAPKTQSKSKTKKQAPEMGRPAQHAKAHVHHEPDPYDDVEESPPPPPKAKKQQTSKPKKETPEMGRPAQHAKLVVHHEPDPYDEDQL